MKWGKQQNPFQRPIRGNVRLVTIIERDDQGRASGFTLDATGHPVAAIVGLEYTAIRENIDRVIQKQDKIPDDKAKALARSIAILWTLVPHRPGRPTRCLNLIKMGPDFPMTRHNAEATYEVLVNIPKPTSEAERSMIRVQVKVEDDLVEAMGIGLIHMITDGNLPLDQRIHGAERKWIDAVEFCYAFAVDFRDHPDDDEPPPSYTVHAP